ncbi:GNAT family N-acetyltransferase [Clostridium sp. UBA1652]|uniref:GNAT family N-acetyltransferase n=1 Tax=Clostridium sp. UBA1652 TaxID=1946348 RepID=UPI00257DC12B|nr:GNAT family N-acetyltransferase [Clostridium sp. UBA1652]
MNYRKAKVDEIDILIELRKKQLIDEGISPDKNIDYELKIFFHEKMKNNTLTELVVEDKGEIVATGAVVFYDFPPSYTNKTGKKAYITNMYTKDEYRGQGIASKLLEMLVQETKKAGIFKMWLHASKLGRPVYKKFGFKETDEFMELSL